MITERNERGVFVKGHTASEEVKNKIAQALDRTGDLTKQRFGRWVALEKRSIRNGIRYWFCHCDCGTEKEVGQRSLVNGRSTGCLKCSGRKNTLRASNRNAPVNGRYKHPGNGFDTNWWTVVRKEQFEKQKGICAICLNPLKTLNQCFDHDHESGLCRELVHRGCNVFIGFIENHPGVVERVQSYIARYEIGEGRDYATRE